MDNTHTTIPVKILANIGQIPMSEKSRNEMTDGKVSNAISETTQFLMSVYDVYDCAEYYMRDWNPEHYHFGIQDPEYVKAQALTWISEIKQEFKDALRDLYLTSSDEEASGDNNIKTACPETKRMSKAVRELDNDWTPHSRHSVLMDTGYGPYFRVQIPDSQMSDILAHPENYVIVDAILEF